MRTSGTSHLFKAVGLPTICRNIGLYQVRIRSHPDGVQNMTNRTKWALAIVALWMLIGNWQVAAQSGGKKYRRAKLPKFSSQEASRIFFDDVFSTLVGQRPSADSDGQKVVPSTVSSPDATPDATAGGGMAWSKIVSATTIEDVIKTLKLGLDKLFTTPSAFAGRGYKPARQSFTLLAMLFAVVDQYDGDVRWKSQAPVARDMFARTAANLKAGGSIQVYNEAKQRKLDLDDIVRGSRLEGEAEEDKTWDTIVDRTPLMQLLETRFETNLKQWTNSKSEFNKDLEKVQREAEMVVVIAEVLMAEDMDDAGDDEYREFAQLLKDGGQKVVQAVKSDDVDLAAKGVTDISRSCVDCHDFYR